MKLLKEGEDLEFEEGCLSPAVLTLGFLGEFLKYDDDDDVPPKNRSMLNERIFGTWSCTRFGSGPYATFPAARAPGARRDDTNSLGLMFPRALWGRSSL